MTGTTATKGRALKLAGAKLGQPIKRAAAKLGQPLKRAGAKLGQQVKLAGAKLGVVATPGATPAEKLTNYFETATKDGKKIGAGQELSMEALAQPGLVSTKLHDDTYNAATAILGNRDAFETDVLAQKFSDFVANTNPPVLTDTPNLDNSDALLERYNLASNPVDFVFPDGIDPAKLRDGLKLDPEIDPAKLYRDYPDLYKAVKAEEAEMLKDAIGPTVIDPKDPTSEYVVRTFPKRYENFSVVTDDQGAVFGLVMEEKGTYGTMIDPDTSPLPDPKDPDALPTTLLGFIAREGDGDPSSDVNINDTPASS